MAAKQQQATAEEFAFANDLNRRLAAYGATVSAYSTLDDDTQRRSYGLVFCHGSKRHTITSDVPFHYDSPDDLMEGVKKWLDGGDGGWSKRWSTDPRYAD